MASTVAEQPRRVARASVKAALMSMTAQGGAQQKEESVINARKKDTLEDQHSARPQDGRWRPRRKKE